MLGVILLGVFASTSVNVAGADGLLLGGTSFFIKEVVAVALAGAYAFVFTYGALFLINLFTPVRISEKEEESGLDISLHGEKAYL